MDDWNFTEAQRDEHWFWPQYRKLNDTGCQELVINETPFDYFSEISDRTSIEEKKVQVNYLGVNFDLILFRPIGGVSFGREISYALTVLFGCYFGLNDNGRRHIEKVRSFATGYSYSKYYQYCYYVSETLLPDDKYTGLPFGIGCPVADRLLDVESVLFQNYKHAGACNGCPYYKGFYMGDEGLVCKCGVPKFVWPFQKMLELKSLFFSKPEIDNAIEDTAIDS